MKKIIAGLLMTVVMLSAIPVFAASGSTSTAGSPTSSISYNLVYSDKYTDNYLVTEMSVDANGNPASSIRIVRYPKTLAAYNYQVKVLGLANVEKSNIR